MRENLSGRIRRVRNQFIAIGDTKIIADALLPELLRYMYEWILAAESMESKISNEEEKSLLTATNNHNAACKIIEFPHGK